MAAALAMVTMLVAGVAMGATTSLEFYMHDNFNLAPVTTVRVASGQNASSSFGTVVVIDDPLTQGPETSSQQLGRAQGTYMFTALDGSSLLLTFTAVLGGNDTISFHGADRLVLQKRDIAIIGGTGKYRMARGFATLDTTSNGSKSTIIHFTCTLELP